MVAEALQRNWLICARCGASNRADDRFCERCGLAQHGVGRPAPTPARTRTVGRRGLVPVIVSATVIVVLGLAGGIFLMRPGAPAPDRVADLSPEVRAVPTSTAPPPSPPSATPTMPPPPALSAPIPIPAPAPGPAAVPAPSIAPAPAGRPAAVPAGMALRQRHAADRAAVDGLVGRWVPQISSKAPGLVVGGVTYDDDRIWSDFRRARATYSKVVLVRSADFRSFQLRGHWVTVVGRPFASAGEANTWCARQGFSRLNCFAKRLSNTSGPTTNTVLRR